MLLLPKLWAQVQAQQQGLEFSIQGQFLARAWPVQAPNHLRHGMDMSLISGVAFCLLLGQHVSGLVLPIPDTMVEMLW